MKRLLMSLIAVAMVGTAHAVPKRAVKKLAIVQVVAPTIVRVPVEQKVVEIHIYKLRQLIETRTKKGTKNLPLGMGYGTCSGAFVSDNGDILTAKHCADEPAEYEIITADHRSYAGVVIATSTTHDLALLHIDRRSTPFFELATTVSRGQAVFVLGSPLGITDALSTGIVARIDGDWTLLDCSILPGNSGGPVFDKDDKLVGIATSVSVVMLGLTHLSQAQGVDAVYFFLKEAFAKRDGKQEKK